MRSPDGRPRHQRQDLPTRELRGDAADREKPSSTPFGVLDRRAGHRRRVRRRRSSSDRHPSTISRNDLVGMRNCGVEEVHERVRDDGQTRRLPVGPLHRQGNVRKLESWRAPAGAGARRRGGFRLGRTTLALQRFGPAASGRGLRRPSGACRPGAWRDRACCLRLLVAGFEPTVSSVEGFSPAPTPSRQPESSVQRRAMRASATRVPPCPTAHSTVRRANGCSRS